MDGAEDTVPIGELLDERRHLLDVARWTLGATSGAESVVEETYRRWYELSEAVRAQVGPPLPWLTRTARSICLARRARPARSGQTGAQVVGRAPAGTRRVGAPGEEAGRLLPGAPQSFSPPQRARRSRPTTPEEHDAVARAVREACAADDAALLRSLLCPDVTAIFDGGGRLRARTRPVHGGDQAARSLLTLLARRPRTTLTAQSVNGRTGIVVRYDHQVAAVVSFDIAGRHVVQVCVVLNPEKLRSWNRPAHAAGSALTDAVPGGDPHVLWPRAAGLLPATPRGRPRTIQ